MKKAPGSFPLASQAVSRGSVEKEKRGKRIKLISLDLKQQGHLI